LYRQHHVAKGGGEAVGGCHRGQADDDIADETERTGLQALVTDDGGDGSFTAIGAIYGRASFPVAGTAEVA